MLDYAYNPQERYDEASQPGLIEYISLYISHYIYHQPGLIKYISVSEIYLIRIKAKDVDTLFIIYTRLL